MRALETRALASCVFAAALAVATTGAAQEARRGAGTRAEADDATALLAQAERALEEAAFAEVDAALDRATLVPMSRAELLRWLELRALVSYADERLGAIEEALAGYASLLEPEAPSPAVFPTPLRARLEELREGAPAIRVAVEVAVSRDDGGRRVALPAQVVSDPGHLVREVRVVASVDGSEPRLVPPGASLPVPGDEHRDVRVEHWVEVLGPGGALLVRSGSPDAPLEAEVRGTPRSSDHEVIAAIVGVSVAVVAGVAVLAWGATENWWRGHETHVQAPALVRF